MQSTPLSQKFSRWLVPLAGLVILVVWWTITPPGLLGKADALGYAVCHRIDERSFHVDGQQLPLCARCSGMYLGAMVGLAFQFLTGRRRSANPPLTVIIPLVVFVVAFVVDGSNSYLYLLKESGAGGFFTGLPNLYIPNNTLRLFTGSGMGLGIAVAVFPAFNQTLWVEQDSRAALPDLRHLGLLLVIMLLLDLGILTDSPVVLYPVAFISAAGVLVLLSMVYSMLWTMVMRQENLYTTFGQLWLPLVAGMTIALIQITAIDLLRYWLTGTWGGFQIG
jgi:uncharacterized membrane protein